MSEDGKTYPIATTGDSPRHQLAPGSFEEVMRWAEFIASSGIAPEPLRGKPNDVAIVLLSGMELGVPPMTAMRQLPVVKGKVSQMAEFMLSRCLASPVCEWFTCLESTEERATWEAKRRGTPDPVRLTYTMAQAVKAGAGDMYRKHPAAMLRARASSALARMVFADVIGGLYAREELEDDQPAAIVATPIRAQAHAVLDAPTTAVPVPGGDELTGEVMALREAMGAAESLADLDALQPRLRSLPEHERAGLRGPYMARREALAATLPSPVSE